MAEGGRTRQKHKVACALVPPNPLPAPGPDACVLAGRSTDSCVSGSRRQLTRHGENPTRLALTRASDLQATRRTHAHGDERHTHALCVSADVSARSACHPPCGPAFRGSRCAFLAASSRQRCRRSPSHRGVGDTVMVWRRSRIRSSHTHTLTCPARPPAPPLASLRLLVAPLARSASS